MQPFENGYCHKILIANRGEIAIRICRAVAELGWSSLAVAPNDDPSAQHLNKADEAAFLPNQGVSAYLDIESMVDVAKAHGCTMVHPGYGFLSENSNFAKRCAEEGLIFVGPGEETLKRTGDKVNMRKVAKDCGINFAIGSEVLENAGDALSFMQTVGGPILLKAVCGGGG
ncbi:biotin carboxylase N-terminal domain-containing protein [uncultured Sneathiella sp.]|uniref:biotin carboxylase N-terminal domain-containing protein n=1 Tax=uncultured Sneathiella sp. TaxID=879315 RepID=UPI0030DB4317|tara:strand:- start:19619 stop:20131 length:513 start_codon:yes stop_codon:yes gene_type:complete